MGENIKLIILVNSEKVIWQKILREASQSFVKIGKNKLSFLKKRILLDMVSWKSCGRKRRRWRFFIQ